MERPLKAVVERNNIKYEEREREREKNIPDVIEGG